MRALLALAVLFLACLVQVALISALPVASLQPHLPLLLLALWSLRRGLGEALALAIPTGLLLGLLGSQPPGVALIALALALPAASLPGPGWRQGARGPGLPEEGLLAGLGALLLASVAYYLLEALLLQALGYPVPWWPATVAGLVGGALVNAVLGSILYWPLERAWRSRSWGQPPGVGWS